METVWSSSHLPNSGVKHFQGARQGTNELISFFFPPRAETETGSERHKLSLEAELEYKEVPVSEHTDHYNHTVTVRIFRAIWSTAAWRWVGGVKRFRLWPLIPGSALGSYFSVAARTCMDDGNPPVQQSLL